MQAEVNLLAAALQDPMAQRFVTLSESCVPIYPAEASWLQLMAQPLSRINACLDQNSQGDLDRVMLYRYCDLLGTAACPAVGKCSSISPL